MRLLRAFLPAFLVLVGCCFAATNAWASDDEIDSWDAIYTVNADGSADVTETIVWRFGSYSGRHGINRDLIVREKWDEEHDASYPVSNIKVESPDASSHFETSVTDTGASEQQLRIRIGDPDETVNTDTATYILHYRIDGVTRVFDDHDEFYWDVLGDNNPSIKQANFTVSVPGGVTKVACYTGWVKSDTRCQSASVDGDNVAHFSQSEITSGSLLTVVAGVSKGELNHAGPILVQPLAAEKQAQQRMLLMQAGAAAVGTTLISALVGWGYVRKRRDDRYAGVAPGNFPVNPQEAPIIKDDGSTPIPVFFNPPAIPVALAGVLEDGVFNSRETTATLLSLAVRGHLTIVESSNKGLLSSGSTITLVRRQSNNKLYPFEANFLNKLFGNKSEVTLDGYGMLQKAHKALNADIEQLAQQDMALFKKLTPNWASGLGQMKFGSSSFSPFILFAVITIPMLGFSFDSLDSGLVMILLAAVLPALLVVLICKRLTRRGTRSADGRVFTDQVIGFREYISTAEADQIRFEEGEDIFSKFLPWAAVFGETKRWVTICERLIKMGRLSADTPYWYAGANYHYWLVHNGISNMVSSVSTASMPEPAKSSGSGFGGGSGFSGGFSGGGGGGGGSSSW